MRRMVLFFLATMAAISAPAAADIYRWEDPPGTLNFTDDLTNVPDAFRKSAEMYQKEPPPGTPSGTPSVAPPPAESTYEPPPPEEIQPEPLPDFVTKKKASEAGEGNGRKGAPTASVQSEIDQLKAKIEAKEKLIASVDDRRNLAKAPLVNRIIDPSEMELYNRYKAELPADKARLKELEGLSSR